MSRTERMGMPSPEGRNEDRFTRVLSISVSPPFAKDWNDLVNYDWEKTGIGKAYHAVDGSIRFVRDRGYRIEFLENMIEKIPGWVPLKIDSEVVFKNPEKAESLALLIGLSFGISRLTDGPNIAFTAYKVGLPILQGDFKNIPYDEVVMILGIPAAVKVIAGTGLHIYFNRVKKRDVDLKGAIIGSVWPAFYGPIVGHLAFDRLKKMSIWQNILRAQTGMQDYLVNIINEGELKK